MTVTTKIRNLVKLSNLEILAVRAKRILQENRDILHREEFIEILVNKDIICKDETEKLSNRNLDKQMKILDEQDISILMFEDEEYPENLKALDDSPAVLYLRGDIKKEDKNAVAIVGTRKATEYGKSIARKFASELCLYGITIVSGLARGIDTHAHIGTVEKGKGRTLAVMGTGIDKIYPASNRNLAHQIVKNGALITEYAPLSPPLAYHFPSRNRIISGLSLAILAVEAPLKSGVFHTVKWALDYGRDVYTIPGDIDKKVSRGTNKLLKMGAIPATSPEDITENSDLKVNDRNLQMKMKTESLPPDEETVYNLLDERPKSLDKLIHESGFKPHKFLSVMAMLEIKGLAREVSGKRYIKEE